MEKSKFRQTSLHNIEFYEDVRHVPISNSKRICTDILCTIVGVGLTITLAIFAIVLFNRQNYLKQVFPADTDGKTCGYEYPGYNILYFAKPTAMGNRVCVRSCPTSSGDKVACKKTSKSGCELGSDLQYYDNVYEKNEYGQFCFPKDEGQKKELKSSIESYSRDLYYNSVHTISKTLLIVAAVSVVYMLLVQCIPRIMNRAAVVIGALSLIGLAITILLYKSSINAATRYIVFAFILLFFLVMICVMTKHYNTWSLNGIFLDFASKFVLNRIFPLVMPIVFLGLGVAFYFFQLYQYRSFWTFGPLKFDPQHDLYHKIKSPANNIVLSVFQLIQIIWGTFFLKQAFNYLVSSEAVQWYYGKGSACGNGLFTLVCKHIGSVIACAFMNAFFGLLDFICDALIPNFDDSNPCFYCINRFAGFFDLARSDAMSIVYLSGNAYCNSARYAQYLVNKYHLTQQSQSSSRIYRYCSHFAIAGVNCILAFWVFSSGVEVSISGMGVLLLLSLAVSTFFISLHADAGQAILILYLMEQQFIHNRGKGQGLSTHAQITKAVSQYAPSHPVRGQQRRIL